MDCSRPGHWLRRTQYRSPGNIGGIHTWRPTLSRAMEQDPASSEGSNATGDASRDQFEERVDWAPGFNEYLLGGVIGLTLFSIILTIGLYLIPRESFQIPELQQAARVAEVTDFPVGASRVITWGSEVILVIRSGSDEYDALQGTSSLDGCMLEWDPTSLRVVSPCNFIVYDLHGNVVRGLTTVPLHRYPVYVRQGTVYVSGM